MSSNATQLLTALADLSEEDLAEVHARTSVLLGGGASSFTSREVDPDLELVHDQVAVVLRARGEKVIPFAGLRKQKYFAAFKRGARTLLEYADQNLKPASKQDRVRAVQLLVNVVVRDLARRDRPVIHRVVTYSLENVNVAMESAFPGYRACHLLPMLLKRKSQGV